MGDEDKVGRDVVEEEVGVKYRCISSCYWSPRLYKVGDILSYAGGHGMLKHFKPLVKGSVEAEDLIEDEGPTTLSEIQKKMAQDEIDSIEGNLGAGQAPADDKVPAEAPVEEPVEEGPESLLE